MAAQHGYFSVPLTRAWQPGGQLWNLHHMTRIRGHEIAIEQVLWSIDFWTRIHIVQNGSVCIGHLLHHAFARQQPSERCSPIRPQARISKYSLRSNCLQN